MANSRWGGLDQFRWVAFSPGTADKDAFGRLRVAAPQTLFDSKLTVDNTPLVWDDQQISGTASSTYLSNQAAVSLGVAVNTAGRRVRQTFRRFNYQPGKSQLVVMTLVPGANDTNVTKRWGIFDDQNGLFFEMKDGVFSVGERTYSSGAAVDTTVASTSWDGRFPAGYDLTKSQIFWIDYEWLGVGTVRYGIFHEGKPIQLHAVHHNNVLNKVYMSTPNLPLRYELVGTGTHASATLVCICSTVISEGGSESVGRDFSVDRGITGLATGNNTSIYPLLAIRLKSTHLGADVAIKEIETMCTTVSDWRWSLKLNPTVTGTALSFSSITNSAIEAAAGATNATTVSGGTIIASGYGTGTQQARITVAAGAPEAFRLGAKIDGTADILVLAVQNITAAVETYFGALRWQETY
jgi:hypothetical protein